MNADSQEEEEEVSCKEILERLLNNEKYCDVSLQGTDGAKVPANRSVLSARSIVFDKMLMGDFAEATNTMVPIGFHSKVLKSLVEYIHLDTTKVLEQTANGDTKITAEDIKTSFSLMEAAMYFRLPGLCRKAKEFLMDSMDDSPLVSCILLDVCSAEGSSAPFAQVMKAAALKKIRLNLDAVIASGKVDALSASQVEDILQGDEMKVYQYKLFQLVQAWSEDRHEVASEMIHRLLCLDRIKPSLLSTKVKPSGLVSQAQILEAFERQAHALEQKHPLMFGGPVDNLPSWKQLHSSSKRKVLDFPPMKQCCFRWSIQVEEMGNFIWLGILSVEALEDTWSEKMFAYKTKGGIIQLRNGSETNEDRNDLGVLKLSARSKATLVLDLRPSYAQYGTLRVSVDDGPMTRVFSNLQDSSYVPYISVSADSRITLLSIEEL